MLLELEPALEGIDIHHPENVGVEDDMTLEEWIDTLNVEPYTADYFRLLIRALVGRECDEIGLHYILDYIKSGGGYESLASEGPKGAQSLKIKEGTSAVAAGLAGDLEDGTIYANSPVTRIQQSDVCRIHTANGLDIECKKIIIAIPTNTYDDISFTPPLPKDKRALVSRTMPGHYSKCILSYKRAWWKDLGLVGNFSSFQGPICLSWDTSNAEDDQYSLSLFIVGAMAVSWATLSNLQREEKVLEHLAQLIGPENAHLVEEDLLEINSLEWSKESYLGGAPTSCIGPGDLARYGKALREEFKHIHFAGAETAFEWKGYMEGALRAGSRAADEVIQRFNHST